MQCSKLIGVNIIQKCCRWSALISWSVTCKFYCELCMNASQFRTKKLKFFLNSRFEIILQFCQSRLKFFFRLSFGCKLLTVFLELSTNCFWILFMDNIPGLHRKYCKFCNLIRLNKAVIFNRELMILNYFRCIGIYYEWNKLAISKI